MMGGVIRANNSLRRLKYWIIYQSKIPVNETEAESKRNLFRHATLLAGINSLSFFSKVKSTLETEAE